MPRLRETTRTARQHTFVAAAWRRASAQGWRDMTVDDVCDEAGLSKGAFYAHFASKRALMEALIEDDAGAVQAMTEELERRHPQRTERLRRLTRWMLERAGDPLRIQVLADLWSSALTDPEIRARLSSAVERNRRVLRRWVEEAMAAGEVADLPANALASILLALNDGLMLHRALDETGFQWANVGRAVDALLAGVRTR
jgi:AcrR family transcriptional regulator